MFRLALKLKLLEIALKIICSGYIDDYCGAWVVGLVDKFDLSITLNASDYNFGILAFLQQRRIKHHIDRSQDVTLLTDYHTMLRERDMIEDLAAEEQAAREGLVAGETPE